MNAPKFMTIEERAQMATDWNGGSYAAIKIQDLLAHAAYVDKLIKGFEDRFKWRPIAELHEDDGSCVLMHLDDPGHLELGSNLDLDFDPSKWTHFSPIVPLSNDEALTLHKLL